MESNNNELYHYGVPGMKWGQRRARMQAKANAKVRARRNKANAKVEYLQKVKPKSVALTKAEIKATKIKKSRYGQTNGQIITQTLLKNIGNTIVGGSLSMAAQSSGKEHTAKAIETLTLAANAKGTATAIYKVSTNYKPKNKK